MPNSQKGVALIVILLLLAIMVNWAYRLSRIARAM
jgi:type II secretory pathway component PulK